MHKFKQRSIVEIRITGSCYSSRFISAKLTLKNHTYVSQLSQDPLSSLEKVDHAAFEFAGISLVINVHFDIKKEKIKMIVYT